MITVGVGSDIFMDELQQIATSPRKVFRSDFAGLSDLIGQLRDLICQGTYLIVESDIMHVNVVLYAIQYTKVRIYNRLQNLS